MFILSLLSVLMKILAAIMLGGYILLGLVVAFLLFFILTFALFT